MTTYPATLSGLFVYPIKSLGGVALSKAVLTPFGIEHDRRWMIVRPDGSQITQRDLRKMARYQAIPEGKQIRIQDRHSTDSIAFPMLPTRTDTLNVQIWGDLVEARLVDEQLDEWLSHQLGVDCRLVFFPETSTRRVNAPSTKPSDRVGFADSFPYLITNTASLKALADDIPMDRFRPNLVISGAPAWVEDEWESFQVGKVVFRSLKACARCPVPGIDQLTGDRKPKILRLLSEQRRKESEVYFGQRAIWAEELNPLNNSLQLGDLVQAG